MDLISNYRSGSIRNLSLTLIMLLVILLEVVVSSILFEKEKNEILERHYNEFHKIEVTYNSILNDRLHFYKKRTECVLSCSKIISAIRDKDRENLYKYALPKWQILKEENRFLQVMHFHLPDGNKSP